jgi:hypothetical protein
MYQDFTSLAPQDEQTFVVYERQMQESLKKGRNVGAIVGGVLFLLMMGIYFGVSPTHKASEEEATSGEAQKAKPADAKDAPAEAPAAK